MADETPPKPATPAEEPEKADDDDSSSSDSDSSAEEVEWLVNTREKRATGMELHCLPRLF